MKFRRIEINPHKQQGRPCIKGTRISVYDILDYLNSGMSIASIVEEFPPLTEKDIHEALNFIKYMHDHTTYSKISGASA